MIRLEHIDKKYRKIQALDNINADFIAGQSISLIGPNGSGKTTLIKCILDLVRPDRGEILIHGKNNKVHPEYRSQIGYMPQIGRYPDHMKVGQLFSLLITLRQAAPESLDYELYEAYRLNTLMEQRMHSLSGGTRQKVSAALAFLFNPDILILDEPTAGLDPLAAELLKAKINKEKARNKLILITSHILSDLEDLITHVIYLQEGKLIFFKELSELQQETGELRLNKAIASVMKSRNPLFTGKEVEE
ncbi:MAG: ABC transporter ATP-binding protein [Saprospiraceae bacterium]|nr:ABC transporter ATP-binding protein [Saprospiraceae bacterium]